jgi:hypothetical protein
MGLLKAALSLERAHMEMFTELAILYSNYRTFATRYTISTPGSELKQ